ncbi:hypothetical protein K461DRAFT_316429 [Myriangium duriaei CBS 260.36]|uniref:Uncharacterized protein n=1 Tax=Myriangium duriaei CBS 260.36 TaxID=1168546 RepID=A0A9P4ISR9_9PEZI|nr:hypothetical protein K461DRAFT_316429 [Myriangium duriaei CBS 260.36]
MHDWADPYRIFRLRLGSIASGSQTQCHLTDFFAVPSSLTCRTLLGGLTVPPSSAQILQLLWLDDDPSDTTLTVTMQSFSSNVHYPTIGQKLNDSFLATTLADDVQLQPDQIRIWSNQLPALEAGDYTLDVQQTIQPPGDKDTQTQDFSLNKQYLQVSGPKLKLLDPNDIHSVYPPQGMTGYSQTLAHVVFKHPTMAWERTGAGAIGFNKAPWVGMLTFTADELILDSGTYSTAGFGVVSPTRHGTISTTAGILSKATQVATPIQPHDPEIQTTDAFDLLLLDSTFFQSLFSSIGNTDRSSSWTADIARFAAMAHVREMHGGFMASTDPQNPQPQYSVVVSPRTGPVGITAVTRVVSHLISLENVQGMALSGKAFVGLASLHSWDWMCVPTDQVDFSTTMRGLGRNIQPLRIPESSLPCPDAQNADVSQKWLGDILQAGYALKNQTTIKGDQTMTLLRGPLIPVLPDSSSLQPFSLKGEDLQRIDSETGLTDVSYSTAWNLARSSAMADKTFSASLLRLRGKIHTAAVQAAKLQALGGTPMNKKSYFDNLNQSLGQVHMAQDVNGLAAHGGSVRWTSSTSENSNRPATYLAENSKYEEESYLNQVAIATESLFGSSTESGPVDSDALAVRAWILDRFYLAGIPLSYLVADPDMLPRETIRTFAIDTAWIDTYIDGALSLANHFAKDDDAIRREIKNCINTYLSTPFADGPNAGITLQVPKWGFFIRSIAVSTFPDLKIEVQMAGDSSKKYPDVLHMQVVAEDTLMCLVDQMPGSGGLTEVKITQPSHQQSFALGTMLTNTLLTTFLHPIPEQYDPTANPPETSSVTWTKGGTSPNPIYDWDIRMLRPDALGTWYIDTVNNLNQTKAEYVGWTSSLDAPSSLIATQLGDPILELILSIEQPVSALDGCKSDNADPYHQPGFQLCVKSLVSPASDQSSISSSKLSTNDRVPAGVSKLPVGPRIGSTWKSGNGGPSNSQQPYLPSINRGNLIYFQRPAQFSCYPVFDPGNNTGSIFALGDATDLVFTLRDPLSDGQPYNTLPQVVEIRIPVIFDTKDTPTGVTGSTTPLLVVPGTANNPTLPKIQGLAPGSRWMFSASLVLDSLFPVYDPTKYANQQVSPQDRTQNLSVVLVITITPRMDLSKLQGQGVQFDGSFMLRNVNLVQSSTNQTTTSALINTAWITSAASVVQAIQMTVQSGLYLSWDLDTASYDLDKEQITMDVTISQPLNTQTQQLVQLFVQSGQNSAVQSNPLRPGDLATSTTCKLPIPAAKAQDMKWTSLVIWPVGSSNQNISPPTRPFNCPSLDLNLYNPDMKWCDGIQITWNATAKYQLAYKISYTLIAPESNRPKTNPGGTSRTISVSSRDGQLLISQSNLELCLDSSNNSIMIQEDTWYDQPHITGGRTSRRFTFILQGDNTATMSAIQSNSISPQSGLVGLGTPTDIQGANYIDFWYTSSGTVRGMRLTDRGSTPSQDYLVSASDSPVNACLANGSSLACFRTSLVKRKDGTYTGTRALFYISSGGKLVYLWIDALITDLTDWSYVGFDQPTEVSPSQFGGGSLQVTWTSVDQELLFINVTDAPVPATSSSTPATLTPDSASLTVSLAVRVIDVLRLLGTFTVPASRVTSIGLGTTRPAGLKGWTDGTNTSLFLVSPSGDILRAYSPTDPPTKDSLSGTVCVLGAKAALEGALEVYLPQNQTRVLFVFWVRADGSVWAAYGATDPGKGFDAPAWAVSKVAPAGAAHAAGRIRVLAGEGVTVGTGFMVVYFDPSGRLQVAIPYPCPAVDGALWWSRSEFRPVVDTPTSYDITGGGQGVGILDVATAAWTGTTNVEMLFVKTDWTLGSVRVEVQGKPLDCSGLVV